MTLDVSRNNCNLIVGPLPDGPTKTGLPPRGREGRTGLAPRKGRYKLICGLELASNNPIYRVVQEVWRQPLSFKSSEFDWWSFCICLIKLCLWQTGKLARCLNRWNFNNDDLACCGRLSISVGDLVIVLRAGLSKVELGLSGGFSLVIKLR